MGSRTRAIGAGLVLLLAGVVVPRAARAEPTASEKETARAMMDEGHARRDAGDHKGALAQFQGADALMHVPTTGIEVGREQIALGQLVEARDTLERVTRIPVTAGEPDAFRAARKAADTLDQQLPQRIPSLQITVAGGPPRAGVTIKVDGAEIPVAALISPFKVDPGHHVVVAAGSDGEARQDVDVAEGQTLTVALARSSSPPAAPLDAPVTSTPRNHDDEARSGSSAVPWLRWGGVGLLGAGAIVGGITGAMSLSSASTASKGCVNDRCPPPTWGNIDSARTTGAISTAAFIVAGAGAVLAVTSFAIAGNRSAKASGAAGPAVHVTASIGPGAAFFDGTF
jgi:hypothetical protein